MRTGLLPCARNWLTVRRIISSSLKRCGFSSRHPLLFCTANSLIAPMRGKRSEGDTQLIRPVLRSRLTALPFFVSDQSFWPFHALWDCHCWYSCKAYGAISTVNSYLALFAALFPRDRSHSQKSVKHCSGF